MNKNKNVLFSFFVALFVVIYHAGSKMCFFLNPKKIAFSRELLIGDLVTFLLKKLQLL